jgi:membrane protease YdiL (CAAX protease family)
VRPPDIAGPTPGPRRSTSRIVQWTRQHRLTAFFALTFTFSWWAWPAYHLGWSPTPFFACGPLLAALVIIGVTEGRSGYRGLGSRMLRWRVGWLWWAVALGLPLAVLALAALANVAIWDAPVPVLADMAWPAIALTFAVRFVQPLDGPLGEEPGFRGYAVPQLQAGRSPLAAVLVLAPLVALWHLPIVVVGALPPFALLVTFAITFVYVWLFNRTGGSVLMTLVFHVAQGTVTYAALGFTGADAARMDWLTGSLWCLIAVGLVVLDRKAWLGAPPSAVAEPSARGRVSPASGLATGAD